MDTEIKKCCSGQAGGVCTGDTGDGLLAREIGDVDERVVERGVDVGNTEDELALADLGAKRDGGFLGSGLGLLGGLRVTSTCQRPHPTPNAPFAAMPRSIAKSPGTVTILTIFNDLREA